MARLSRYNQVRPALWGIDPFEVMQQLMDATFNGGTTGWNEAQSWGLPIDVVEKQDAYVVRASIPGIDPEALDVTLTDNVLTIQAESKAQSEETQDERYVLRERRYGRFTRSISLPMPVEADKIEASCANGELTLTLPKAEAVRPRRIAIQGAPQHNVIEGQAQSLSSSTKRAQGNGNGQSRGWAEGQAEKPKTAAPDSQGFAEGQATRKR